MTKSQQRKLDALIGKLESLQHEVADGAGLLRTAKQDLIRFRAKAEADAALDDFNYVGSRHHY